MTAPRTNLTRMDQPSFDPAPRASNAGRRRTFLRLALGTLAGTATGTRQGASATENPAAHEPHWRERILLGFGTTLWLRAAHADAGRAEAGLNAAVAAIREVESQMSLFDAHSALSRLNRDGVLHDPSRELLEVLSLALHVCAQSDGAFDVTVQPLMLAWQRAHREARRPSAAELRAARALVGWRGVHIGARRIALRTPGMALTLNGIAQGYAADRAKAALQAHGIGHALLDTGEWAAWGEGPGGQPWALGVENPRAAAQGPAGERPSRPLPLAAPHRAIWPRQGDLELAAIARLAGRAIATSSDAHTAYSADLRDHHILDPRAGRSPRELASVSVAAPSAALADALTKVFFMAGGSAALPLAKRWGVDVLVVDKAGRRRASPGFARS
jgi:FAD:protein FMN transferase